MTDIDTTDLAKRGGIAAVAALLVNIALLQLVLRFGLVEPFRPVAAGPIGTFTVVGVIGATIVYGWIAKRRENHDVVFTKVAAGVLLASSLPDILLLVMDPSATVTGVLFLMVLHVTTAIACVRALTGRYGLERLTS
jgi:hypothetical protein